MNIRVIASRETEQRTIDQLAEVVPVLFPQNLALKLVSLGERYSPELPALRLRKEELSGQALSQKPQEVDILYWLNIAAVLKDVSLGKIDDAFLVLVHRPYCLQGSARSDVYVSGVIGGTKNSFCYGGSSDPFGRVIVAGIPAEPSPHNAKVCAYEIARFLLKEGTLDSRREGEMQLSSCSSRIWRYHCIMNTAGISFTSEGLEKVSSRFCDPCTERLYEAGERREGTLQYIWRMFTENFA